ncbi:hypothetical protein O181_068434 [Austropuccinia psidii MF-1]|uniref:Uncharacterized protein n=1 Tax=Austropuccinia psidii MF-1 TaxID=1389203 RepID=A0A9Q3EWV6_9BASI|nr:hypothetical protein [Austropuccinia psidii MF-1]
MLNPDIMQRLIQGELKDNSAYKTCIPGSSIQKITIKIESPDSDSDTSSASNPEISEGEVQSLQGVLQQEGPNVFPSSSKLPCGSPIHQCQLQQTSEDPLVTLSSFDPDYVPTSDFPSEFDVNTLCKHQIRGENFEFLQKIIPNTMIPTS